MQGLCKQIVKVLKMMEKEGIELNLIMLNVLINVFGNVGKYMEVLFIYYYIKESVCIIFNLFIVYLISSIFFVKYYV